jgi:hypothetical protein
MSQLVAALLVVGLFAGVLVGLVVLSRRARRRGVGGGLMGVFDELYHPMAHQTQAEVRHQEERPAPAPLPGDRPYEV